MVIEVCLLGNDDFRIRENSSLARLPQTHLPVNLEKHDL